jgi:predicted permease
LQLFLEILTGITLPILGLVAVGYGVQRRLSFDLWTLTRLQVYVLLPGALI